MTGKEEVGLCSRTLSWKIPPAVEEEKRQARHVKSKHYHFSQEKIGKWGMK
jgi:hypothetical protein